MRKSSAVRKSIVKEKKKDHGLVRDIMSKVENVYVEADRKLADMSRDCLGKQCKLKDAN